MVTCCALTAAAALSAALAESRASLASWVLLVLLVTILTRTDISARMAVIVAIVGVATLSIGALFGSTYREILAEAIAGLKPDDRIVLGLRYYRDMKIEDIAAVLGVPSGTATSRLHRAHQRLRTALEADGPKENRDE